MAYKALNITKNIKENTKALDIRLAQIIYYVNLMNNFFKFFNLAGHTGNPYQHYHGKQTIFTENNPWGNIEI